MALTLLIDLDDTLLKNDMDRFLPAYLQLLSSELASFAPPDKLIPNLLDATRQMVGNRNPDCTLEDVFSVHFYPSLGLERDDMRAEIERFYSQVFPALRSLTSPNLDAIRMVEAAFARGYKVAITTNPLFPRTAILQRLDWAGFSTEKYPFDLVTSYEKFHFTKPQAAYFAEAMAYLGWPEGPAVVIGDDVHNDITASQRLGLPSFWINNKEGKPLEENLDAPTGRGGIGDFITWLDHQPPESLHPNFNLPSAILAILRSTPAALQTLFKNLSDEAWKERPRPGEWSLTEILCHLRDVEMDVNLPRLRKALQETNPFLAGMDTDLWAEERDYYHQNGPQALHRFTAARLGLLDLLEGMPADGWQRPIRHAIFGPTQISELVSIIAGHDRLHIQQVLSLL